MPQQQRIVKDAAGKLRFYSTETLGPKQRLTPEGFLVCEDVAIARTGTQLYLADEVPIEDPGNGEVRIFREEGDVFRPETIASFEGKSVTIDHPDDFVTPENWKELTFGTVQNVRRGTGPDTDLLIADLLITDEEAIKAVRAGLREVSCGYEADYEQDMPGVGYQRNIIGNHVALVERGRAGPRCSIQDKETITMKKPTWLDKLKALVHDAEAEAEKKETGDEDETEAEKKEESKKIGDTLAKILDRLKAQDAEIKALKKTLDAEEEKEKTEDEEGEEEMTADTIIEAEGAGKADDGTTYKGNPGMTGDTLARAEILSPGIKLPTKDGEKTADAAFQLQRKALTQALSTELGAAVIVPLLAGRTVDKLSKDALHSVFLGASELIKQSNNANGIRTGVTTKDFGRTTSIQKMNEAAKELWANRS